MSASAAVGGLGEKSNARTTNLRFVRRIDRVAMFGSRKATAPHVVGVVAERALDIGADLGVATHEPGPDLADEVAENVVRDDELAIDVRPGTNAIHRNAQTVAH